MCCTRAQDTQSVSHTAVLPLCWQLKLKGTNPLRPKDVVPHKHELISAYFVVHAAQNKWRISAPDVPQQYCHCSSEKLKNLQQQPCWLTSERLNAFKHLALLAHCVCHMSLYLPPSLGCIFRSGQSFCRVLQRLGHRAQWHHRWPGTPSADTKVQEIFDPRPGIPVRFLKSAQLLKVVLFV